MYSNSKAWVQSLKNGAPYFSIALSFSNAFSFAKNNIFVKGVKSKNFPQILVIAFAVLFSSLSHSNSQIEDSLLLNTDEYTLQRFGFRHGNTYVPLNIKTVSETEAFYHISVGSYQKHLPDSIRPMYEVNIGEVSTSAGTGYLVGVGPRLEFAVSDRINLGAAFRFVYLDRHVYRTDFGKTKHYGGPRQFQYYWEANYRFYEKMSVGYRWQHMSNGMQVLPEPFKYNHNPVINTHNIVFTFGF